MEVVNHECKVKKPSKYKAKALRNNYWYEGYYFEMPETTYCFVEDGEPEIRHFLVYHQMIDWGLPNDIKVIEIDVSTLKEITE